MVPRQAESGHAAPATWRCCSIGTSGTFLSMANPLPVAAAPPPSQYFGVCCESNKMPGAYYLWNIFGQDKHSYRGDQRNRSLGMILAFSDAAPATCDNGTLLLLSQSLSDPGGAGEVQAQLAQLHAQGLPGDAQQEGGPVLVAAGVLQDAGEQDPIQLAASLRVQVAGVWAKPLAEERLRVEPSRGLRRLVRRLQELGEKIRQQDRAMGPQERLLQHTLQLTYVPWPGVTLEQLQRFGTDS